MICSNDIICIVVFRLIGEKLQQKADEKKYHFWEIYQFRTAIKRMMTKIDGHFEKPIQITLIFEKLIQNTLRP